jgi:hypothetical protein
MRLVPALLLALAAPVVPLSGWAAEPEPPLVLWGFQRGCEALSEVDRQVVRELEKEGLGPVHYLGPDSSIRNCQGAACAQVVQSTCGLSPDKPVRILGGQIESTKDMSLSRVRLWMHHTGTGKTAFYDTYCHGCTLGRLAAENAVRWAMYPTYGAEPGPTPGGFCGPPPPPSENHPDSNTIFWVVFGKDAHKAAISTTLKRAVKETGTESPLEHGGKPYSLGVLKKIVAKDRGAQVLGAEVLGPGEVELFLFDGPTELTENARVDCKACDKDALSEQVYQAAHSLLRHCFAADCAKGGGAWVVPPKAMCEPWPEPQRCGGTAAPLRSSLPSGGGGIDPKLATLVKGSVWGLFAASAAGAGVLFGLSGTDAGTYHQGIDKIVYALDRPAWALTGAALATLGVAIPLTVVLNRKVTRPQTKPSDGVAQQTQEESGRPQPLRCPR